MRRYLILVWIMCGLAVIAACTVGAATAKAQQITGTPGSPSATITLDGKQLPAQDQLRGNYFQAVERQNFNVFFVRMK